MATPPNDDTKTLFRLLADREWHNYDKIKKALAQTVAPGRALRKYQERVDYSRRYDPTSYKVLPSEDEQIELGKVACAQIAITSWKGRGIISRGTGEEKEIKVKPGFTSYGIPGFDAEPEGQDPPSEPEGLPEVPPDDSEPFEGPPGDADDPEAEFLDQEQYGEAVRRASTFPRLADERIGEEWTVVRDGDIKAPTVFTVDEVDGVPQTATACSACGMLIVDMELHEQWHLDQAATASQPVFTLEEVRSQVDNALAEHLDAFQVGMTNWLTEQFAMLEQVILSSRTPPRWREASTKPVSPDLPPNKSE